ncbi:ATP-grasp domain-containing protein [Pseudoalteromonas luteoviolacea]|uniref:ATP-grasp domain-containing protein n=1 Tax=Pseudoalteromonas luteoviolacea TaxID=43657 RepID=UPI001B39F52A|nr:ATP-grasp domain-containing protein [Pseudoalteromonas luteoviolacea]MBQ4878192.1 ATP-grasp domain-containing protein [Pseudoalteromonas luteoviolacea]MBQ4907347.1 ATP-grasp domain-containing protein [Pseudoalteromonas luteoviolacea]
MDKALLVFDPMNHQMKVVEAALKRGLSVVAITTMPLVKDLPYGACVDRIKEHIEVDSWLNTAALEKAFQTLKNKYRIVATYSAMEVVLPFEAWVREQLNLPTNSPQKVKMVLNKGHVRKQLLDKGLSQLSVYDQDEVRTWRTWPDGLTAYFKPSSGSGSSHVAKCTNLTELQQALTTWDKREEVSFSMVKDLIYGQNEFILEESANGELLSVESLVFQGKVNVVGLTSRTLLADNNVMEMGTQFPYEHPLKQKIIEQVKAIHESLEVFNGATHTEVMVDENGVVELIELNLRFAGADVLTSVNIAFDIELEQVLLDLAMGREPTLNGTPQNMCFVSAQYLLAPDGLDTFESITFPKESVFSRTIFPIGKKIPPGASQSSWLGGFILADDDYKSLMEKANHMRSEVEVNGKRLGASPTNKVVSY